MCDDEYYHVIMASYGIIIASTECFKNRSRITTKPQHRLKGRARMHGKKSGRALVSCIRSAPLTISARGFQSLLCLLARGAEVDELRRGPSVMSLFSALQLPSALTA